MLVSTKCRVSDAQCKSVILGFYESKLHISVSLPSGTSDMQMGLPVIDYVMNAEKTALGHIRVQVKTEFEPVAELREADGPRFVSVAMQVLEAHHPVYVVLQECFTLKRLACLHMDLLCSTVLGQLHTSPPQAAAFMRGCSECPLCMSVKLLS